jgi:hypothetical protein
MEEPSPHTQEYLLKEAQAELRDAHHRNAILCNQLRIIKSSRWHRLGKFLRLAA